MHSSDRRGSLAATTALLVAVSGVVTAGASRSRAQDRPPPNVLVVVVDDQRAAGTMRVMPKTEHWLGAQGTRFTNAYATTPNCCPSRASIFTGQYAHNHGVRANGRGQADNLNQETTLQRYLSEGGYRTAIFGKFLNGWRLNQDPPHFDTWGIFSGRAQRYAGGTWNLDGRLESVDEYSTDFISDRAADFLESSEFYDDQPWFLYLAPLAPHAPWRAERDYRDALVPPFRPNPAMLETDRSDKPDWVQGRLIPPGTIARRRAKQLRTLMSVDDLVDRTLSGLEDLGERSNTLVFYLSDNGLMWGEHGIAGKRTPYTPSIEIPFYASWPGVFAEDEVEKRVVANIDLAPTIFDATGIEPEHVVDGRPLLDDTWVRDRILIEYWKPQRGTTVDWASLRTGTDQYVEHYLSDRLVVTYAEYYELVTDPWQLANVLDDGYSANDPDTRSLSLRLNRDLRCQGTQGLRPCP